MELALELLSLFDKNGFSRRSLASRQGQFGKITYVSALKAGSYLLLHMAIGNL